MAKSVPVYAINLDRSRDRWDRLKAEADRIDVDLRRVPAVEGRLLNPDEIEDFDAAAFRRRHGRVALPTEIGCYFSHLRALETIAAAPEPYAVVVEDDIVFLPDFKPVVAQLTELRGWDVVKLIKNRPAAFRPIRRLDGKIAVGRCLHGPQGCAAAYLVTRDGAARVLAAMRRMRLPFDVELERGWAGGYRVFSLNENLVKFAGGLASTIIAQGRSVYAKTRLPTWRRGPTLLFRTVDYLRRIAYALRPARLEKEGD